MDYRRFISPDELDHVECWAAPTGTAVSIKQARAATGADIIINWPTFEWDGYEINQLFVCNLTRHGKAQQAQGLAFPTDGPPRVMWDNSIEAAASPNYASPYAYLVRDGVISDGLKSTTKKGRIAVGLRDDSTMVICGSDSASSGDMAQRMLAAGCQYAMLGDGSDSAQWIDTTTGEARETSRRVPAYICVYLRRQATAPKEETPVTLKVKCRKKTQTYTPAGMLENGRYISAGDVCEIDTTLTPTLLHKITYPIKNGTRTAYTEDLANFILA